MHRRLYIAFFLILNLGAASAQNNSKTMNAYLFEADSLELLARKAILSGKKDSSLYLLNIALGISYKSGNNTMIARCLTDFAALYMLQGKYKLARQYMNEAWPYLEKTDHYDVKIFGITQRANLYNVLDKKDSAIYFYKMAEKYNAEKMPYQNWIVYMALGELFNQTDDLEEAKKYFRKSHQLTYGKENKPDHGYLLTVFINFYMSRNITDGAGKLIAEYNELMEERKRKNFVDPLHGILINVTNNKLESNLEYMKAVKESCLQEGQLLQAMVANGYIVTYYEKKNDIDAAIIYAEESEQLAEKTGGISNIYSAKKIKYGLLKKAGKHSEANKLAESLFELKDSMLVLQKREQLYELEQKFETEKKEKEIAVLTSDKKMSALELQQQIIQRNALSIENLLMDSIVKSEQAYNISLSKEKEKEIALNAALERENSLKSGELIRERKFKAILIGGAILLLLATGIILMQYKKQRAKNLVIQKQSDELQVLMKEIHHRVKNNLQVISSLLDLQSMTITDSQASEAVKEGKNRVQSMALIHQNLYSDGNLKGIRAKEYIKTLMQSLCDSYNITNDKVKVNTKIDDLNLDVDTMIPLGLVLNELVSNSLKYAFKDGRTGELNVVLKESEQKLLLKVSDNGTGYPEGMNIKEAKSFGLKMVRAFAQKLKAKLDIYNDNGAVVEMTITKYNMA